MESNKIRAGYHEASKKILIPISFGVSSLALLHILDAHVQKRSQQGRHGGYSIHLLSINEDVTLDIKHISKGVALLKELFPLYDLSIIPLQDCFTYGIEVDKLLDRRREETKERPMESSQRLQYVLAAAGSPSSKDDILDTLRRRLICAFAEQQGFDFILFGDTTTRLAEKILAQTAKGRGSSASLSNADAIVVPGVPYIFPMRDLLRKEVQMYIESTELPLDSVLVKKDISSAAFSLKNMSIDGLMSQYIESVEENYPSIVSNVVRTTLKLRVPDVFETSTRCGVCLAPIEASNMKAADGEQQLLKGGPDRSSQAPHVCYGCERTFDLHETFISQPP